MGIKKAERKKRKARILLAGPSGAGKSMTALRLAKGLTTTGRALVIDSENAIDLYADGRDFDVLPLEAHDIDSYLAALDQGRIGGYEVVVVDSASHLWQQILDLSKRMTGNSFANWGKLGAQYDRFVQTIRAFPAHIIITTKAKMKYEQGADKKVEPVGLDPIMRDGFEYEVDLYGMIDIDHNMTIRKTRLDKFADKIFTKPGEELGTAIRDWLAGGKDEAPPPPLPEPTAENGGAHKVAADCKLKGVTLAEIARKSPKIFSRLRSDDKIRGTLLEADLAAIVLYGAAIDSTTKTEGKQNV